MIQRQTPVIRQNKAVVASGMRADQQVGPRFFSVPRDAEHAVEDTTAVEEATRRIGKHDLMADGVLPRR